MYITGVDIGKTVCTLNLAAKEISSVGSAKIHGQVMTSYQTS